MADKNDYLTQAEYEVLENRALRQQAKTIDTYLSLVALAGISEDRIIRGLDHVRTLDKYSAKELRAKLVEIVKTLEFLESNVPEVSIEEVVADQVSRTEPLTELSEASKEIETVAKELEVPELPEIKYESLEDAPVAEFAYLDKIFDIGKLDIREDTSVVDIAATIYEMIGRPEAGKTADGSIPDLENRILRRLIGDSTQKIATEDGSTAASVNTWFYQRVQTYIGNKYPQDPEVTFNELLHVPEIKSDEPSIETELINDVVETKEEVNEYTLPALVEKLFGDISIEDLQSKSTAELAAIIYEMAGSPKIRRNPAGITPDPISRIQQLLEGVNMKQIGLPDQASENAIQQWFYQLQSKVRGNFPLDARDQFQRRLKAVITEQEIQENEKPEIVEAPSGIDKGFVNYDSERFVKEFTALLGAYEDNEVLFIEQWLSANQDGGHTDFATKQYKIFAQRIGSQIPNDLAPLNINGNEKVVLRKLLGLYTQGGRREYKDPIPVSVQLVTSKDVEATEKDLASSVNSLLDYLKQNQGSVDTEVAAEIVLVEQREILKNEILSPQRTREEWLTIAQPQVSKVLAPYFDQKEITHLWNRLHFGENGEHNEQFLRLTGPTLRKLEVLYVDRDGKARAVTERSSSMLRMFTATFQGPQSLDTIYEKFARRSEEPITKADVERGIVGELSELLSD